MDKRLTIFALVCFMFVSRLVNAEPTLYQASSPEHRVAFLELYTSEGCSSCPPADAWLSQLEPSDSIVPLAMHVTYWDYIGWKDRFADAQYDNRQRDISRYNHASTIYTPQFVFNGKDYHGHNQFAADIARVTSQPATVHLKLSAKLEQANAEVTLSSDIANSPVKDVVLYLALYEHNLTSVVKDGENEGRTLHHDYVVRKLYGPFIQSQPSLKQDFKQLVVLAPEWKTKDLNLAVFAQNPHSGEILQAMKLALQ